MRAVARERLVVAVAVLMCLIQLALRGWGAFGAWFQLDDVAFMSQVFNKSFADFVLQSYNGHLMPSGFILTWVDAHVAPWSYRPMAAEMMGFQAIADLGAIVFLCSAFGRRPGILPPLAIFLFTAFTVPVDIWWAAGVNQLPTLCLFFWGGWTHLRYLRGGGTRWAVATMVVTVAALTFQERALLVFWLYGFMALAYFARGNIVARIRQVLTRYRAGVLLYAVVAVLYLGIYAVSAYDFGNSTQTEPFLGVVGDIVGASVATGLLGGPVRWALAGTVLRIPDPGQLAEGAALVLLALLAYELGSARRRSRRAWWLVAVILLSDCLLVAAARPFGPGVWTDYRYTTEIGPLAAIALGLATLPLRGAAEQVEARRRSPFLDRPWLVGVVSVVIAGLGAYSSLSYAQKWRDYTLPRTYFGNVAHELTTSPQPVPLADEPVPDPVYHLFNYRYPENLTSHLFKSWSAHAYYPDIVNDRLLMADDTGHLQPVVINPVRFGQGYPSYGCPYPLKNGIVTVVLDGPVLGSGWWVRVTYVSQGISTLHVHAGLSNHSIKTKDGLHSLFFTAEGKGFDRITFASPDENAKVCFADLQLGTAEPAHATDDGND